MPAGSPYDAREVSNYILKLSKEDNTPITQMSLLKILFYAHGWYLVTFGRPLFRQPVEAWKHGPVVKVVRDAFKDFGKSPITQLAGRMNLETGEIVEVGSDLQMQDADFVKGIFVSYSRYSSFTLSDMTHSPGSPWDKIWNSKKEIGRLGLRIKNEEIELYFLKLKALGALH